MKICYTFILAVVTIGCGYSQNIPLQQIELKSLKGERITMDRVIPKGKNVIVSFWATWCGPCKKELDAIKNHYNDWQKKYNVELIAISTDDARTAGRVKATVLQKKWSYTVFQDIESMSKQVFNFDTIPFTALFDSGGNLVYTHIGYSNGDEIILESKLKELR